MVEKKVNNISNIKIWVKKINIKNEQYNIGKWTYSEENTWGIQNLVTTFKLC